MNEVFTEKKKGYLDTGINIRSLKTMYLTILPEQRCIKYKEVEIPMTRSEFDVLLYFAGQPGRVFTKDQILQIAGSEDPQDEDNAVRCLIAGIRKKLRKYTNKEYIQTVRGVGYRFVIPKE